MCWPAGGWAGSCHDRLQGCSCPCVILLVVEALSQADLLVDGVSPGVSGSRSLGVPGLVLVHCCVGLGPESSGGLGHVQGWV